MPNNFNGSSSTNLNGEQYNSTSTAASSSLLLNTAYGIAGSSSVQTISASVVDTRPYVGIVYPRFKN